MVRHYNVSYDYFFDDSTASHINIGNVVAHNRVGVGNVNINDDVKFLRQAMCKLEDEIKDKDEMINWLKGQINVLTELLKNSSNCLQKSEPKWDNEIKIYDETVLICIFYIGILKEME